MRKTSFASPASFQRDVARGDQQVLVAGPGLHIRRGVRGRRQQLERQRHGVRSVRRMRGLPVPRLCRNTAAREHLCPRQHQVLDADDVQCVGRHVQVSVRRRWRCGSARLAKFPARSRSRGETFGFGLKIFSAVVVTPFVAVNQVCGIFAGRRKTETRSCRMSGYREANYPLARLFVLRYRPESKSFHVRLDFFSVCSCTQRNMYSR